MRPSTSSIDGGAETFRVTTNRSANYCSLTFGGIMGKIIIFVSRSERERLRLIRRARAYYDSIFPPIDRDRAPANRAIDYVKADRSDGVLPS